ncbi:hypothetical protein V500_07570 [Pseudogymnoascus sp. VKM F-4518 (FW-2643)]|nr:hypothetical protein V500_07570 [Pseudogymnoascus sp. VKM F-4518 (FW-2643)]
MKFSTALIISASAALTSATGPDYDPTTGKWTCHVPDAVYCAGDSLKTNIIIRCTGLVGQPGNCNDNLAGEPPVGVQPTLCYAPELHKAACAKNCIVYGGSGNLDGTFPLPADVCTPTETSTSTSYSVTAPTLTVTPPTFTPTTTEPEPTTTSKPEPTTTTKEPEPTTTSKPEPTATTTEPEPTATTTEPEPTTTSKPEPTSTAEPTKPTEPTTVVPPTTITITISQCPTTPLPPATITTLTPITNGTVTAQPTGGHTSKTNTPVGPSNTITPPIPGAGVRSAGNGASLGMVVLAAVVVAFGVWGERRVCLVSAGGVMDVG